MVSAASKSQFSPFCSCIARHKGHEDLASFSPSYHQQSAYGSHLNGRKYEGKTCEGDCAEGNGTGNQQDGCNCRDYKEEDPKVASRYCHQLSKHNWCMGAHWRRACTFGDDSPCLNDLNHLVNQRAKQKLTRVPSSISCGATKVAVPLSATESTSTSCSPTI